MRALLVRGLATAAVCLVPALSVAAAPFSPTEDDITLEVRPDRLGVKDVLNKGFFVGNKTAAVAAYSADPGLHEMTELVRDKTLWELEGEFIIVERKALAEDEQHPWTSLDDVEDAAKEKRADLLFVAELVRGDTGPTVNMHLFKVGGDEIASLVCKRCLIVHRWTEYHDAMRKELAFPRPVTGYTVRKRALILDGLMGPPTGRPKGKVGLMVQADTPELAGGVAPLAQLMDERLRKTVGVDAVIVPESAESIAGKSEEELVKLGASSGTVMTVVARLSAVAGTGLVRVTMRRLDDDGRPQATSSSVALVVASHGTRDPKALVEFKRRAIKSEVKGEISELYRTNQFGTPIKTGTLRDDVMVLKNAEGAELDEDDAQALNLTPADRSRYEKISKWNVVKSASQFVALGSGALIPVLGVLGCLLGAAVGIVPALSAGEPSPVLLSALVGAAVGFCPVGGAAALAAFFAGGATFLAAIFVSPRVPHDHVPAVARHHNMELAKALGVDPVDVDPDYFPDTREPGKDG